MTRKASSADNFASGCFMREGMHKYRGENPHRSKLATASPAIARRLKENSAAWQESMTEYSRT